MPLKMEKPLGAQFNFELFTVDSTSNCKHSNIMNSVLGGEKFNFYEAYRITFLQLFSNTKFSRLDSITLRLYYITNSAKSLKSLMIYDFVK